MRDFKSNYKVFSWDIVAFGAKFFAALGGGASNDTPVYFYLIP